MGTFNTPPSHTNNKRGEQIIRIKTTVAEKKKFTIAYETTASEREFQL